MSDECLSLFGFQIEDRASPRFFSTRTSSKLHQRRKDRKGAQTYKAKGTDVQLRVDMKAMTVKTKDGRLHTLKEYTSISGQLLANAGTTAVGDITPDSEGECLPDFDVSIKTVFGGLEFIKLNPDKANVDKAFMLWNGCFDDVLFSVTSHKKAPLKFTAANIRSLSFVPPPIIASTPEPSPERKLREIYRSPTTATRPTAKSTMPSFLHGLEGMREALPGTTDMSPWPSPKMDMIPTNLSPIFKEDFFLGEIVAIDELYGEVSVSYQSTDDCDSGYEQVSCLLDRRECYEWPMEWATLSIGTAVLCQIEEIIPNESLDFELQHLAIEVRVVSKRSAAVRQSENQNVSDYMQSVLDKCPEVVSQYSDEIEALVLDDKYDDSAKALEKRAKFEEALAHCDETEAMIKGLLAVFKQMRGRCHVGICDGILKKPYGLDVRYDADGIILLDDLGLYKVVASNLMQKRGDKVVAVERHRQANDDPTMLLFQVDLEISTDGAVFTGVGMGSRKETAVCRAYRDLLPKLVPDKKELNIQIELQMRIRELDIASQS